MSVYSVLASEVESLKTRHRNLKSMLDESLSAEQRSGAQDLNQRQKSMLSELRQVGARGKHAQAELKRAGDPAAQIGISGKPGRATTSTAGMLAPLNFGAENLRKLQGAMMRNETCRIETRDFGFSTADPLLPPQLYPYPIAAQHENRLLDRLPGYAIESPSVTFIRHISTTGEAGPVHEGDPKPELIFNTDALTATAVKLAAHNGLSWEIINDWPAFQSYCGTELYKRIIDIENYELIQGNLVTAGSPPTTDYPGFDGFLATDGILKYDATSDTGGSGAASLTALDAVEKAIAKLRLGPALAVPDLIVLNPSTWSAIRRVRISTEDSWWRLIQPATRRTSCGASTCCKPLRCSPDRRYSSTPRNWVMSLSASR